ncbi:MAG: alpha/beta hydrolase [Chloroflexi bacterium]|jgi:pimeloyl-ACP methyl ester carboxylesterase|nr:alpha/beta hydrolase [Chloroflexota bacterium]
MVKLVRFLGNLVLLAVLCTLCVAVILLAYGRAMVDPWQNTPLGSQEATWIWVGERPMHVRTWGSETGKPLVLVHGFDLGGAQLWTPIGPALGRAGYRVIAPDLPPLGLSAREAATDATVLTQVDFVAGVLEQLGAQGATVVAQGWGSAVALQLAVQEPQFVRSLVLVGPQLNGELTCYERIAARLPFVGDAFIWLTRGGGPLWRWVLRNQVAAPSAELSDYARSAREATHIQGTVAALRAFYRIDPAASGPVGLSTLDVPCLVVHGALDRQVTREDAEAVAEQLHADVLTIKDAGHLVVLDQPQALREAIAEAVSR